MDAGITLDLREGFFADEVVVSADGLPALSLQAVSTRMQTGLARSLPLPLAAGAHRLRIELPALGLVQELELPAERPLWVGVSVNRGRDGIEARVQGQPFGYV